MDRHNHTTGNARQSKKRNGARCATSRLTWFERTAIAVSLAAAVVALATAVALAINLATTLS